MLGYSLRLTEDSAQHTERAKTAERSRSRNPSQERGDPGILDLPPKVAHLGPVAIIFIKYAEEDVAQNVLIYSMRHS